MELAELCPQEDLQGVIKSISALYWAAWKSSHHPSAARVLHRLHRPMVEMMSYSVGSILQDMRSQPGDPDVQSTGVYMLQSLIEESEALKRIVLAAGAVDVLVQGMQQHPTNEKLLSCTLKAIDELHGLPSLLRALDHLKDSPVGARAALWALVSAAKARWEQVASLPPKEVSRVLLSVVDAQRQDPQVVAAGLEMLANLTAEEGRPEIREAFAAHGGWPWLLDLLEATSAHSKVQYHGARLLSSLGRGGAWGEAYVQRALVILERMLCTDAEDDSNFSWAFWAISRLNGARALVGPMRGGAFKTTSIMVAALKSLAAVSLGQSDGAPVEDMPAVIDAVVYGMGMFPQHGDVLSESSCVLGHAAAFVMGAPSAEARRALLPSAQVAVNALLELLRVRMSDANMVCGVCEALAEIVEACDDEDSPIRAMVSNGLFGGQNQEASFNTGDHLMGRVIAAHVSHDHLQTYCLWLAGVLHGVAPVLQQMANHRTSHSVQYPAIKTLAMLYGERVELDPATHSCLPEAIHAVVGAMAQFPDNIVLQQCACWALFTMAEHGRDIQGPLAEGVLLECLSAAAEALTLVRGRRDSHNTPASYNALYLRKEASRVISAVCSTRPALSRWLRERGIHEVLADALRTTANSVWDGRRDREAEETLRQELLALCYVTGPQAAILESLRRWGTGKPAVARAAADAVVDMARGAQWRGPVQDTSDPTVAEIASPVQALSAAGCGAELLAMMHAHASDEDLQGRLHLAAGFIGCNAAVAA